MKDPQEIFDRLQANKKQKKDLQKSYQDGLRNNPRHQEITEEMKELREDKKMLEAQVKEEFASELDKLDELKLDIETDNELLKDIILTKFINGEKIEIVDEYDNPYEPVFSVRLRKNN